MSATLAFDFILFGGTGDLAMRKLFPALYQRFRHRDFQENVRIIGVSRQTLSTEAYRQRVTEEVRRYLPAQDWQENEWQAFLALVDYVPLDATKPNDSGFSMLKTKLGEDTERIRVFYLATSPHLFAGIAEQLAAVGLNTPNARVVLEKPLGRDLASATAINSAVGAAFRERQIYRIDHYLGKEMVQNLLALRFGNTLFEPLWSRSWIRDVQITLAETVGVETRGEFYEQTGALRDMVQNHLLQLLCIVAMEPPASIEPDAVRDAKLQVLRALKPFSPGDVQTRSVRGQYRAGAIAGQPVPGYLEETGIATNSRTETFVALKAELANWRWAGVPFFLRTGKRMQERRAEIVVNFRSVPHSIFEGVPPIAGNQLVIRLQPDDGLNLHLMAKTPGDAMTLQPIALNLAFADAYKAKQLEAYERLVMDAVRGKLTLFMRRDEVDAAWRWIEPILDGWEKLPEPPKSYTAGTWGPSASSALIGREGYAWHEEN